ncbi:MAG: hypothetical protein EXR01_08380 [Acetobacteraceae bacterium]|nr:hypothetical protein [Acetobacteraceae bacterium]
MVLGRDNFAPGPVGIGMLASMEGIGALVGAMGVAFWVTLRHYAYTYVGSVILCLVMLFVVKQSRNWVTAAWLCFSPASALPAAP